MSDYPNIWSNVKRELTGITGTPRTDLLGEDATFEAGVGARKVRIDTAQCFTAPIETSVAMDGTEKTLFEITDAKSSWIEAWLDLSPMQAGDKIVVRYYRKVKAAGAYGKYVETNYNNVQSEPMLCILARRVYRDVKVTAEQTGGVNRTLDVQVVRAAEA